MQVPRSHWHQRAVQDPARSDPPASSSLQAFTLPGVSELWEQEPQRQDLRQASRTGPDKHTADPEALPSPLSEPTLVHRGLPTMCILNVHGEWCEYNTHTYNMHIHATCIHSEFTHSAHNIYSRCSGCEHIVHLPQGLPYPPVHAHTVCMTCAHKSFLGGPHIEQKRVPWELM